MAKVTEVKVGLGPKNHGEFRVGKFNLFDEKDAGAYAALRTKANDASSGILIENVREYSRKTVIRDTDPDGHESVTTVEDIYLVVQYWEKKPRPKRGDTDESTDEKSELARIPRSV